MAPPEKKQFRKDSFRGRGNFRKDGGETSRDRSKEVFRRVPVARLFQFMDIKGGTAIINETRLLVSH